MLKQLPVQHFVYIINRKYSKKKNTSNLSYVFAHFLLFFFPYLYTWNRKCFLLSMYAPLHCNTVMLSLIVLDRIMHQLSLTNIISERKCVQLRGSSNRAQKINLKISILMFVYNSSSVNKCKIFGYNDQWYQIVRWIFS